VRLIKIVRPSRRVTEAVAHRGAEAVRRKAPIAEVEASSARAEDSSSAQKVFMRKCSCVTYESETEVQINQSPDADRLGLGSKINLFSTTQLILMEKVPRSGRSGTRSI
jgi:hypothetical protein